MMDKTQIVIGDKVILITGVAGFIGSHLAIRLLREYPDALVVGIDNMNDYYDVKLKKDRLASIESLNNNRRFIFRQLDIVNKVELVTLFEEFNFDIVVSLAAQAGVRHSLEHPDIYISSNIIGFYNILEACRHARELGHSVRHLVYASSSSVYGENSKVPYSTEDKVDSPVSLYAATKRCDELLAHSYSKLYGIPSTGLRFFTVYGPYGRPDMAYFSFTDQLVKDESVKLFNNGHCERDFTYIDDIIEGIVRVMCNAPAPHPDGHAPHCIYNIGHGNPVNLQEFVNILVEELVAAGILPPDYDIESHKILAPMQPGDVAVTYADTSSLLNDFGFCPSVSLRRGLRKFARWYSKYYSIS